MKNPETPEKPQVRWRKSSYSSAQNACVEVAPAEARWAVRDSKDPDGSRLIFSAGAWQAFLVDVKRGKYCRRI